MECCQIQLMAIEGFEALRLRRQINLLISWGWVIKSHIYIDSPLPVVYTIFLAELQLIFHKHCPDILCCARQFIMPLIVHPRVDGWLPRDHHVLEAWLDKKLIKSEARRYTPESFAPVIREFQHLIGSDPEIYMGFHRMFEQVLFKPPYNNDPTGKLQVNFGYFNVI